MTNLIEPHGGTICDLLVHGKNQKKLQTKDLPEIATEDLYKCTGM